MSKKIIFIFMLILLVLVEVTFAKHPIEETVIELQEKYKVPGVAIGIVEDGQIAYLEGYGYRDKDLNELMTSDTVFQLASISKPISTLGVMMLVEEGLLDLDTPIVEYLNKWELPESDYDNSKITIRHLLSHTSGLGPDGYLGYKPEWDIPTLIEALDGQGRNSRKIVVWDSPGNRYAYSGGGFTIMELIIEEITGMDFAEYMDNNIFEPLDLRRTSYNWRKDIKPYTSKAYSMYGGVFPNYLFAEHAAASLYSTTEDMTTIIINIINDYHGQGNLLSQPSYIEMFTPILNDYGLGWKIIKDENKGLIVEHGGSNIGWKSYLAINLENKSGIVILANSDRAMPFYQDIANEWYAYEDVSHRINTTGIFRMYLFDLYQRAGSLWYSIVNIFR